MNKALDIVVRIATLLGDAAFAALTWMGPGPALWVLSAVLGVLMMLMWRYTSNQNAIADIRRRISADLLATRLFKDNLAVTFRSQRRIVWQAIRLLGYSIRPMLIMMIPFVLIISQIGLRYEFTPAPLDRPLRVTATVAKDTPLNGDAVKIRLPEGMSHDANDPCRAELLGTVDWRISASRPGVAMIELGSEAQPVRVPLAYGEEFTRLSSLIGGKWYERLLYSAEPSLPAGSPFESIRIDYPKRSTPVLGFDVHWLVSVFVLSIVFALVAKPFLKVHI